MVRSTLPLLALATLGAAFVLPRHPRLAVRVRADDTDGAAPRAAPEVNSGAEAIELLIKDPEGYKLAREEYNEKVRAEIMDEGAPDRTFLLQALAVGLCSFAFGLYGPKRK